MKTFKERYTQIHTSRGAISVLDGSYLHQKRMCNIFLLYHKFYLLNIIEALKYNCLKIQFTYSYIWDRSCRWPYLSQRVKSSKDRSNSITFRKENEGEGTGNKHITDTQEGHQFKAGRIVADLPILRHAPYASVPATGPRGLASHCYCQPLCHSGVLSPKTGVGCVSIVCIALYGSWKNFPIH